MVNPRNRNNIQWHPVLRTKPQANNFLICKNNFLISKRDQRPPFDVPELSFRYKFIPLARSFQNRGTTTRELGASNLQFRHQLRNLPHGADMSSRQLKKQTMLTPFPVLLPSSTSFLPCTLPLFLFCFFPTKQARKHLAVIT